MKKTLFVILLLSLTACGGPDPTGTVSSCNAPLSVANSIVLGFTIGTTTANQIIAVMGPPNILLSSNPASEAMEYRFFDGNAAYCGEFMFYIALGTCVPASVSSTTTAPDCSGILQSFTETPATY